MQEGLQPRPPFAKSIGAEAPPTDDQAPWARVSICFAFARTSRVISTPPSMRATGAALFLLANSLVGLSLGTAIVPLIDNALFDGRGQIGPALATVGLCASLTAALAAWSGLRSYAATNQAVARG